MPWVRIDDQFGDHEKVAELFDRSPDDRTALAALGLHLLTLSYCARRLTDGHVPRGVPGRLGGDQELVALLADSRLWQADGGGHEVHDYLDYNPSKAKVEGEREAARERMKKVRNSRRSGEHSPNTTRSSPSPEPVPEPTTEETTAPQSSSVEVERPEIGQLCEQLADAIEAQGFKRPNARTKRWEDAARRLLDLDGATPKQVEYAIRWATGHDFWAANIRSMPKLREKWETIVMQIRREAKPRRGGSDRARAGEDMRELARLADELRERGE